MTQITDPREIHQRAMAQTESIVAAVQPGQLGLPTPCTDYDVRALLSHTVGGLNRIALVEVPWGKVPGRIAVSGYVQEILTHGWDLARATGQPTELDPELASWVLAVAQRILPPEPRGGEIPFGPVIPARPPPAPTPS